MKIRDNVIRVLTHSVGLKPLRQLYIKYSAFRSWLAYGDSTFPRIISIEINTHCNRRCSYCPNVFAPSPEAYMSVGVFDLIAHRLGEINYHGVVDFVFFSEALLHPELEQFIRLAKCWAPKCIPRICTNGDFLTEKRIKSLLDAGLTRIYLMRHRPVKPGWDENIESLDKMFPGVLVRMDINELEETDGLHNFGGRVKVNKQRAQNIVDGKPRCYVHAHVAQIGINGDWLLCCVDYEKTTAFGNLLKESIMEIWNKEPFKHVRKSLRDGIPQFPVCDSCSCIRPLETPK